MKPIRSLALVLCLGLLFSNYSNSQNIETTGNVVDNSQWNNAVYQNSLTCWSSGDPGYCGPNPIVRPGGNVNFSYGTADLYQIKSIASILPNSGTGLQVNGFTFGFTAKNGNGWDDGRLDYLSAYVKFYGANGKQGPEYDYTGYTNKRYNWSTFSFSETFSTPYGAPELSSVRYGLIGRDNNGWAGPYGPEVYNINFSLKYSVDPCATNVLYSTSCAGYFDALAKLSPKSSTPESPAYTPPPDAPDLPPPPPGAPPPQQSQNPPSPPNTPSPTNSNNPPSSGGGQSAPTTQTAGGGSQERQGSAPGNLGLALSLIARNSDREKAIAQQAVTSSVAEAQAAGDKAQQVGTSTASAAVAMSTSSAESAYLGSGLQVTSSTNRSALGSLSVTQQPGLSIQFAAPGSISSYSITQQVSNIQLATPAQVEGTQTVIVQPTFLAVEQRQQEVENQTQSVSFLTDLNNPIKQVLEAQQVQQTTQESPASTPNRNPPQNDLAVGVNLAQMATIPQGYTGYLNFALKDSNFYDAKPIYQNQRVVDNQRVLRGLGSDLKHQQMVQDQYR